MSHDISDANVKMFRQWATVKWGWVPSNTAVQSLLGRAGMVCREAEGFLQEVKFERGTKG